MSLARFTPQHGEKSTIRFRTTGVAHVSVAIASEGGTPLVLLADRKLMKAGEHEIVWKGLDPANHPVPPGVYRYTIVATGSDGTTVRFDPPYIPREVHPAGTHWDATERGLVYTLSEPARVRILAGVVGPTRLDFLLLKTVVDWAPRPAGVSVEPWDGKDASGVLGFSSNPHLGFNSRGFTLPLNTILISGPEPPGPLEGGNPSAEYLHARHPRGRCFDPPIAIRCLAPEADCSAPTGGSLPVRIAIDPAAVPRLMGRRSATFIFVDGVKIFRDLNSYSPVNWRWDLKGINPGPHYLTVVMAWPEDHYASATTRVVVEGMRPQTMRGAP